MERRQQTRGIGRGSQALVVAAFGAFLIANLIHNRFGLDPAIIPSAVFVGLLLWRPRRWVLLTAALFIAVPSLLFFKLAAITRPADAVHFINHVFLLLAALAALAGLFRSLVVAENGGPPEAFDKETTS